MVDRLMRVFEIWLDAQLARAEDARGDWRDGPADSQRAKAADRKQVEAVRCVRCKAPFCSDEGRRRHLREAQCAVREDAQSQDVVERSDERRPMVESSVEGWRNVFRVLAGIEGDIDPPCK